MSRRPAAVARRAAVSASVTGPVCRGPLVVALGSLRPPWWPLGRRRATPVFAPAAAPVLGRISSSSRGKVRSLDHCSACVSASGMAPVPAPKGCHSERRDVKPRVSGGRRGGGSGGSGGTQGDGDAGAGHVGGG